MAITKISCRSGTTTSGDERKNAPPSQNALVIGPVRWRRHSKIARVNARLPRAEKPKASRSVCVRQLCT